MEVIHDALFLLKLMETDIFIEFLALKIHIYIYVITKNDCFVKCHKNC